MRPVQEAGVSTHHYDWRDDAECLDADPELFFPIGNTGAAIDQIEEAKAYCRRCPVIADCLEFAFRTRQEAGVWGGLSEDDRRAMARRAARIRLREKEAKADADMELS